MGPLRRRLREDETAPFQGRTAAEGPPGEEKTGNRREIEGVDGTKPPVFDQRGAPRNPASDAAAPFQAPPAPRFENDRFHGAVTAVPRSRLGARPARRRENAWGDAAEKASQIPCGSGSNFFLGRGAGGQAAPESKKTPKRRRKPR